MIVSYKYRLLPTKRQHAVLRRILEDQRQLYNAGLEERIGCYRKTRKLRGYYEQCRALTDWRKEDYDASAISVNIQRWTLKRLDQAFRTLFRGGGFPRFRAVARWRSFGFNEFEGIALVGGRIRFKGMRGTIRVHFHRPMPEGRIGSCVFTRDARGWSVSFQVEIETPQRKAIGRSVGIDLGLSVFAYQSDGVIIPNPRIARRAEAEMRKRQRLLARCKRGSKRREKAKSSLGSLHRKIVNARTTWLHQQSARIAKSYDLIAAEDLNVAGMVKNRFLSRSISDASWSSFLGMLSYKAERAGSTFITVNPRNTSKRCSGCGELVPKSLAIRTHNCPSCGLVIDRDWNAAKNILAAVASGGQHNVARYGERAVGKIGKRTRRGATSLGDRNDEQ